jgi:hypothetical protein
LYGGAGQQPQFGLCQVHAAQTGMVDIVHTTNAYYVSLLPEADAMKLSELRPGGESKWRMGLLQRPARKKARSLFSAPQSGAGDHCLGGRVVFI